MLVIKILSLGAFFGSLAWFWHSPDYEPAIACVTTLSTCILAFVADSRAKRKATQVQEVRGKSVGIQAGGDVLIDANHSTKTKDD